MATNKRVFTLREYVLMQNLEQIEREHGIIKIEESE
ncbi:hypothetical protein DSM106044_01333 [Robinsoniella peoriensis]|uniref:Uncharacterized protein n=1 Tax=Robinsoniella peoriensis TaxID=180332 RepID=A0A4U8QA12_9FIRM|nr:hypothetical protein DSM106044_01333 [Robinsoniella peoriensis]